MCGLIHIKRFSGAPASKMVVKRYRNQETRGQEGFGFVSLHKGKVKRFLKAERPQDIIGAILDRDFREDEIMFHHRRPTSTPNYWQTAHPIQVSNDKLKHDYYVIHNGVVHATEKIKERHDKEGFTYSTLLTQYYLSTDKVAHKAGEKWNDSETFAIELAKDLDDKAQGLPELSGTIAFIAVQIDKATKEAQALFWGCNYGSPLKFLKTKEHMQITSAGAGEDVKEHTLNCYDYKSGAISTKENYSVGYTSYAPASDYRGGSYHKPEQKEPMGFNRALPPVKIEPTEAERSTLYPEEKRTKEETLDALDKWFANSDELDAVKRLIKDLEIIERPNQEDMDSLSHLYDRKEVLEDEINTYEKGNIIVS